MGRLIGIEPATYGSGIRRSRVLKYREKHDFQGQKSHSHLVNRIHN